MQLPVYQGEIPYVTTEQMREVDRAMVEDFHIELIQMMENAGHHLADLARRRFLAGDPRGKRVVVVAGTGGNGGGGLVCARWLHNWGALVQVFTTKPAADFAPIPGHQRDILERVGLPMHGADVIHRTETAEADLIVDAVIGYSLHDAPRGTSADLIRWANDQAAPILALDVPSGVDTTTGAIFDPVIKATATMTLALPKEGLRAPRVPQVVGELYLADIGVPPAVYTEPALGLRLGYLFAEADVIRLW